MKKLILLISLLTLSACTTVPPGYVGIKVDQWGSQKGVQDFPLKTGVVGYNPFTTDVYQFPTFTQIKTWTKDKNEDTAEDESITFNSVEGAVVNADLSISYSFRADSVPHIFVEFRRSAEDITHTYLRQQVRDVLSREASKVKVIDIFGSGKQNLLNAVKEDLVRTLGPKGFLIDTVAFVGGLRVDENVHNSITATIQATQRAIEAENKVRQSQAEAQQKIAEADGEAQRILRIADAQKEANRRLNESLNENVIRYRALERWNGVLPTVTGGATPFVQVNK